MILALTLCSASANPYETSPAPTAEVGADALVWQVTPVSFSVGGKGQIALRLVVPQGWVVYRDMLEVVVTDGPSTVTWDTPLFPDAKVDPTAKHHSPQRPWYDSDVVVMLPVSSDTAGLNQLELRMRHQTCHGSICYRPRETVQTVFVNVTEPTR